MKSPIDRFWEKVSKSDGCWEWTGAKDTFGYGNFNVSGVYWKAHRFSFSASGQKVTDGLCVLHKCDNPSCVNPDHLFLGTKQDNSDDMYAKGRGAKARGSRHGNAKLTEDQVLEIRKKWKDGARQVDLAKEYGVHQTCISAAARGKWWRHVGEGKSP